MSEVVAERFSELPEGHVIRVTCSMEDIPREKHDAARKIIDAALAEVGQQSETRWDGRCYVNDRPVPEPYLSRAAKLACDLLDIPYRIYRVERRVIREGVVVERAIQVVVESATQELRTKGVDE